MTDNQNTETILEGTITRIVFKSPDNTFIVARLKVDDSIILNTIVGEMPNCHEGERVRVKGIREMHPTHGERIRVHYYESIAPSTDKDLIAFLSSGLIKGIGKEYAKRIVEEFGKETLNVIDKNPELLSRIAGIGKKRVELIKSSYARQREAVNAMTFLSSLDIGPSSALRLYNRYKELTVSKIKENPYRLSSEVWGFGFKKADRIARSLGIEEVNPLRARAALRFILNDIGNSGHVCFPLEGILERAEKELLIPLEVLKDAVQHEIAYGEIVSEIWDGIEYLYLPRLFRDEVQSSELLKQILSCPSGIDQTSIDEYLDFAERKVSIRLTLEQRSAIELALKEKVLVITGGPGVGKTTLTNALVILLKEKGIKFLLTAPTGRAAKRIGEATGEQAKTIHRLLGFDPSKGGIPA